MTETHDLKASSESQKIPVLTLLIMGISTLGIFALIAFFLLGQSKPPSEDSAEAGFSRDMILHHTQAVDMGMLLYDRTEHAALKAIALDILLTQQNQIGQMQGWLDLWGLNYSSSILPMTWMGMPLETGLMPGMASAEQMTALVDAQGIDADRLFIEMMIPHHQAGVEMAQAILARSDVPSVQRLARSMIEAQQREITELEIIGEEVGANVIPLESHH